MRRWTRWPVAFAALLLSLQACSERQVERPAQLLGQITADEETREAIDRALSRVYPALVRVHVVTVEASEGRLRKYEGAGSGVIISQAGHVITNHHVAGKARRLVCRLSDGEEIEASLVGTDPLGDIAVLKLELDGRRGKGKDLTAAVFGDSDQVRIGDTVFAMGSPASLSQSVTKGIVSNTAMIIPTVFWPFAFELNGEEVGSLVLWIAHDARISGGSSGGPLVNMRGEVIGINEIQIGLTGAIPSNFARSVAEQLIATGEVTRSWTGLECQPRVKDSPYDTGVLVAGVIEESPAAKAGIEPGDVLAKFDGKAVDCRIPEDLPLFNRLMASTPIGKQIEIKVVRGEEAKVIVLRTEPAERARGKEVELRSWGMTARDFTRMSALERKRPNRDGVLVDSVRPGGPAGAAKPPLQRDDVILDVGGEPAKNTEQLREISRKLTAGEDASVPVLVGFERDTQKLLTVVKIGREPPEDMPRLARKAWLPVETQVLAPDLAKALAIKGTPGVRVTQVYPDHSAEKAGLRVGDILLKLDGEKIDASRPEDVEVLPTMIRQYKIGSEVLFAVLRAGEPMEITVKLEDSPIPASELDRYEDRNFELAVRELSFYDRESLGTDREVQGVLVEQVEHAGWAALAHVALGDILLAINGNATPHVDEVQALLGEAARTRAKRVTFFVKRGIHTMYLEVEPNWGDEEE